MGVKTKFNLDDKIWIVCLVAKEKKCPTCGSNHYVDMWRIYAHCKISGLEMQAENCKCVRYCCYGYGLRYEEKHCFKTKKEAQLSCNKRNKENNDG